jgi:23S rRNA (cytosine1962-C5)-methyltransferase
MDGRNSRMSALPVIEISKRAAKSLRLGHVWVYRSEVLAPGGAQPGDIVAVETAHPSGGRNPLGVAFYNPESLITLRLISRDRIVPNADFWRQRLAQAFSLRTQVSGSDTLGRLVFSEADELPGLIVDRYADVLVIQTVCRGTDRLLPLWTELITELCHPQALIERNDVSARALEGLPERSGVLFGSFSGPLQVREGDLQLLVDPLAGQKTGSYLDQRENHLRAAAYARGRCLDVFSYQGGFGLHLKQAGAKEVTLVDQSERALEAAQATAGLNGLAIQTIAANAFDFLHEQQAAGARYDVVVLDPPAFAKNRAALQKAVRGYKDLNLRAMKLLTKGGILITSSCSYHMLPSRFETVIQDAASDAGRTLQLIERRSAARDHPERLGFPESHYLKCLILRVL